MANLGSTDTPAAAQSLDLPNGYSPAVEEDSGDLVVNDPNGNTALRWDATNGEWNANSNDVTNVGALDTEESVTVTGDDTIAYGRDHGNLQQGSNVAVGVGARVLGSDVTDDALTVSVGYGATKNSTQHFLTAVGCFAGRNNTNSNLAAVGVYTAESNSGRFLTAMGNFAGVNNSGARTTLVGNSAGYNNTGDYTTTLGYAAGRNNTKVDCTAVGYTAARDNTGQRLTAVGDKAGRNNTGAYVTAIGYKSASGESLSDLSTMGDRNTGLGARSIQDVQASGIIGIGFGAGRDAQTDDQLIITQRDGTRRMVMDLTTGDLEITGELIENVSL